MLKVGSISKKNYFFCIINVFHDNGIDNNNKFIGSGFLKNIICNVLCVDESIYGYSNIFVCSKLYLDHMKLNFLINSIFLKGKNIYYIFVFDEYIFFKLFNNLLFFDFYKSSFVKYSDVYIQPIYFCVNNILYLSYFNNYFNFILYRKLFFFLEKFLSIKNNSSNDGYNILFKVMDESKDKNYYLFILYDILLYYIEEYTNIIYLLL